SRAQVALNAPIKTIGLHKVPVSLHPEVEVTINVTVARNADEAQRLARGEDISVAREEGEEAAAAAAAAAEGLLGPQAIAARHPREPEDETARRDAEGEKKWLFYWTRFRERMGPTQADRGETPGVAGVVGGVLLFPVCLKARRGIGGTAVSSAIPR